MKFREHRGNLDDSLETLVQLDTMAQLIEHIDSLYACYLPGLDFKKIEVTPYYMKRDARCGWDQTYIVSLPGFGPIGYTDGMPA